MRRLAIFVVLLALCAACGSSSAVNTAGSAGLGGLVTVTGARFIETPLGVVVVDAARSGHPAIAVPTSSGGYEWVSDDAVGPLGGAVAWLDGDVVRVVGHRCPVPGPAESTTTDDLGNTWLDCPGVDLGVLAFSMSSRTWSDHVGAVALHGKAVDLAVGGGSRLIGTVSDGAPSTGLDLIDVDRGTATLLPSGAAAWPPACRVSGGFMAEAGLWSKSDGGLPPWDSGSSGPGIHIPAPGFVVLQGTGWQPLTNSGAKLPSDAGLVFSNGCVRGAALVEFTRGEPHKSSRTTAYLVHPDVANSTMTVEAVPASDLEGQVTYRPDVLGNAVVASSTKVAATVAERTTTYQTLRAGGTWSPVRSLPRNTSVLVTNDGSTFFVRTNDRTVTVTRAGA